MEIELGNDQRVITTLEALPIVIVSHESNRACGKPYMVHYSALINDIENTVTYIDFVTAVEPGRFLYVYGRGTAAERAEGVP